MRVSSFSLPLSSPLATASGRIDRREGFLVRIERDGVTGVGESTPLPGWTESREACREALDAAAAVLGGESAAQDDHEAALEAVADAPAARHGLELAFADVRARQRDEPLYRHLGGDERVETVPVNATVGDAPVAETVAAAETAVDEGFETVKLKVGARPVDEDLERVSAVRDAVGSAVELRADANEAWTREEATRAFDGFAGADLALVEQPLERDDLQGLADLRGGEVAVAVDETLADHDLATVLDAGAADAVVCKPMVLGGPQAARQAARAALDAGLTAVVTTTVDAVVARTAAVHVAASLPERPACGLATADRLVEDLAADPAPVSAGEIRVPQASGTGVSGVVE